MLIELVHLSDLHLESKKYDFDMNKIKDSLFFENDDIYKKIFFCITGDLTNSNKNEEYNNFMLLQKSIENLCKENGYQCNFCCVPGNHDIDLITAQTSNDVLNPSIDFLANIELKKMDNFFNCINSFTTKRFINEIKFNLKAEKNDISVNFILLNTACFSSLQKDDKDKHFLPIDDLNNVKCDGDYNIVLMHHSKEWFADECTDALNTVLQKSSFTLFGHMHSDIEESSGDEIRFRAGFFKYGEDDSSFRIYLINTDENLVQKFTCIYDKNKDKYIRNENEPVTRLKNKKIVNRNCFFNIFNKVDDTDVIYDFDKIFVMPLISFESTGKIINDYFNFEELIKNKVVRLQGKSGSGKTMICKKLLLETIKKSDYYVLYSNNFNITNNYRQTIRNIFRLNYDGETLYRDFSQTKKDKKILIIDDKNFFEDNTKIKPFIEEAKKEFSSIIITDNILFNNSRMINDILQETECAIVKPFTYKQRYELIEKVCKANNYTIKTKIDELFKKINIQISKETLFDLTSPDLLVLEIEYILKNKLNDKDLINNVFSTIFTNKIDVKIKDNFGDRYIDDCLCIYRELAYAFFSKHDDKSFYLSWVEISDVLDYVKKEYGLIFDKIDFISKSIKANILRKSEDNFLFSKNSYLSYFTANAIFWRQGQGEDVGEDINYLLDHIYFGNYADILLFIAYNLNSLPFFNEIMRKLEYLTREWPLFSFDNEKNKVIDFIEKTDFMQKYKHESKDHFDSRVDNIEQQKASNEEKTQKESFKKEVDYYDRQISNCLGYLEILAKAFGSYRGKLKIKDRENIFNSIFQGMFKLLDHLFPVDKIFDDDFILEAFEFFKKKEKSVTYNNFTTFLYKIYYDIMTTFSLNLITTIMGMAVSKDSIQLISNKNDFDDSGNLAFNNVITKIIAFERYGNEELFTNYIDIIADNLTSSQKFLINRVINLFLITTNVSTKNKAFLSDKLSLNKKQVNKIGYKTNLHSKK